MTTLGGSPTRRTFILRVLLYALSLIVVLLLPLGFAFLRPVYLVTVNGAYHDDVLLRGVCLDVFATKKSALEGKVLEGLKSYFLEELYDRSVDAAELLRNASGEKPIAGVHCILTTPYYMPALIGKHVENLTSRDSLLILYLEDHRNAIIVKVQDLSSLPLLLMISLTALRIVRCLITQRTSYGRRNRSYTDAGFIVGLAVLVIITLLILEIIYYILDVTYYTTQLLIISLSLLIISLLLLFYTVMHTPYSGAESIIQFIMKNFIIYASAVLGLTLLLIYSRGFWSSSLLSESAWKTTTIIYTLTLTVAPIILEDPTRILITVKIAETLTITTLAIIIASLTFITYASGLGGLLAIGVTLPYLATITLIEYFIDKSCVKNY